MRFAQPLIAALREWRAVPKIDPPHIARAQLLQCRLESGLVTSRGRCDQQRRVAGEQHSFGLVVEADRIAAVAGGVDYFEQLIAHADRVPIAHRGIDAGQTRRKSQYLWLKRRSNLGQKRTVIGMAMRKHHLFYGPFADAGWRLFNTGEDGRIGAHIDKGVYILQLARVAEHKVNLGGIHPAAIL